LRLDSFVLQEGERSNQVTGTDGTESIEREEKRKKKWAESNRSFSFEPFCWGKDKVES